MASASLGNLLRHLREQAALSQEELAARAEVSRATIQNVENHRRVPRRAALRRLAAALGVEVTALLDAIQQPDAADLGDLTADELRQEIAELEDEIEHLEVRYERNRPHIVAHLQERLATLRERLNAPPGNEPL